MILMVRVTASLSTLVVRRSSFLFPFFKIHGYILRYKENRFGVYQ